jgi:hypothetical protein
MDCYEIQYVVSSASLSSSLSVRYEAIVVASQQEYNT